MKTTGFFFCTGAFHHHNIRMLCGCLWKASVLFPIPGTGSGGTMSCGIHCSQEKTSASWDKVLNVLFRVSEEIPDRDEIESIYSEFPPHALTEGMSDFWAVSFHLAGVSLSTVTHSLECRGRLNRTGTALLIKTTHGKTMGWGPFPWAPALFRLEQQRGTWGSSSYQLSCPLATEILNCKVLCIIDTVQHSLNKSGVLSLLQI